MNKQFVNILEDYDQAIAKREMEILKNEKEEKEKKQIDILNLILQKSVNLIKRSFENDNILNVSLNLSPVYNSYKKFNIGSFIVNSMNFNERVLTIKNADFCLEFEIEGVGIDSKLTIITVETGSAEMEIQICPELQDDLYILENFIDMQNDHKYN